jgi:SAM-dependent methyltransferase
MFSKRQRISTIRAGDEGYFAYHAPRYAYLLDLLGRYGVGPHSTLLDIGPSRLTVLIREQLGITADSLGFGEDGDSLGGGRHFSFDLNQAQSPESWRRDLPRYDFIVLAEVLEHLYTAPPLVLAFVKSLLTDNGVLVLQTPNAASLSKRIKLLLGRNPYEMIRVDPMNPGHFREYTRKELSALAADLGFRVEEQATSFYFDTRFAHRASGEAAGKRRVLGTAKNLIYRVLPAPLREGITMVWRNQPTGRLRP